MKLIDRFYGLIGGYFRRKRLALFCREFGVTRKTRVLDIGGVRHHWKLAPVQPCVTVVNLNCGDADVVADGCRLPFADQSFDIAYSNSVIEHVADQAAFAAEIRRVAKRFWVQAPDWYSLIEPHYIGPPVHRLPKQFRGFAARWLTLRGYIDRRGVIDSLTEVKLPTEQEMRALFPRSGLLHEKIAATPKSLIAVERRKRSDR